MILYAVLRAVSCFPRRPEELEPWRRYCAFLYVCFSPELPPLSSEHGSREMGPLGLLVSTFTRFLGGSMGQRLGGTHRTGVGDREAISWVSRQGFWTWSRATVLRSALPSH